MSEVELLIQLFEYNAWANEKFRDILATVEYTRLNIETSYGLLLDRVIHIFASYQMWYERINGGSPTSQLTSNEFSSWNEIVAKWSQLDQIFIDYLQNVTTEQLENKVKYTSLDGKIYARKIKDILLHLIQHPTYHRGQISAILKEKGILSVPGTDMVVFIKPDTI